MLCSVVALPSPSLLVLLVLPPLLRMDTGHGEDFFSVLVAAASSPMNPLSAGLSNGPMRIADGCGLGRSLPGGHDGARIVELIGGSERCGRTE